MKKENPTSLPSGRKKSHPFYVTVPPLFPLHPLSDQLLDEDLFPFHLFDPVGDVLLRLLVLGDEDLLEGVDSPLETAELLIVVTYAMILI